MATIVYRASTHSCHKELVEFNRLPVGSIVKCSCGTYHRQTDAQFDGPYWRTISPEDARPFIQVGSINGAG